MSITDEALTIFSQGYNCAQAVLMACGPALGIDQEACARYSGGVWRWHSSHWRNVRRRHCCHNGNWFATLGGSPVSVQRRKRRYIVVDRISYSSFSQQHNSLLCRELLGCDISTSEGDGIRPRAGFPQYPLPTFYPDSG